jgi:hypothetical protein
MLSRAVVARLGERAIPGRPGASAVSARAAHRSSQKCGWCDVMDFGRDGTDA